EPAMPLDDRGNGSADVFTHPHVRLDPVALPTFGGDLFGSPFQTFHVASDDNDLSTAFRSELGRCEAYAGRAPGDDDRLLLQWLELHESSPFAQVSLGQWLPNRIVPRRSSRPLAGL